MREYRRAKRIAHAIKNPAKYAEHLAIQSLPPALRRIYRDILHPPSPEQLVKRSLRSLENKLKRQAKASLRRALKKRPRPAFAALREHEYVEVAPSLGTDDKILVIPETMQIVKVQGMPKLPGPEIVNGPYVFAQPTNINALLEDCEDEVLEQIREMVVDGDFDDGEDDEDEEY
jgi:hypothetical protein